MAKASTVVPVTCRYRWHFCHDGKKFESLYTLEKFVSKTNGVFSINVPSLLPLAILGAMTLLELILFCVTSTNVAKASTIMISHVELSTWHLCHDSKKVKNLETFLEFVGKK